MTNSPAGAGGRARPRTTLVALVSLVALIAGAVSVLGFAPLSLFPVSFIGIGVLAWCVTAATRPRDAALAGFAFGLGLFTCGIGWIYIALHTFGAMPFWLAAPVTLVFAAYLALFPALAAWVSARFPATVRWLAFPAAWALSEWLRGWLFTGFPWLSIGYSQVSVASPFSGFAPVLGVFGVTFATALAASALTLLIEPARRIPAVAGVAALVAAGYGLGAIPWTSPLGAPLDVTLVQGNVAQDMKFREDTLIRTLVSYEEAVARATTPLVILPETALPLFLHELPAEYLARLRQHAIRRDGDVIFGVFENAPRGSDGVFNAVRSLGISPSQGYRKHHLVPFGEFIPLKGMLAPIINDWLHIPLSDQTRGEARQPPLAVAGQKIAVNICYEDVFGEEIVRPLPDATLLANVTNDAWYGESWAAEQHMQISQMRARESGRWMLRATNTGKTAVIDERGQVRASLPQFREEVLVASVQGMTGATPYVLAGNAPVILIAAVVLGALRWRKPGR
jgi:apolipoprotein N-acyltransferase